MAREVIQNKMTKWNWSRMKEKITYWQLLDIDLSSRSARSKEVASERIKADILQRMSRTIDVDKVTAAAETTSSPSPATGSASSSMTQSTLARVDPLVALDLASWGGPVCPNVNRRSGLARTNHVRCTGKRSSNGSGWVDPSEPFIIIFQEVN